MRSSPLFPLLTRSKSARWHSCHVHSSDAPVTPYDLLAYKTPCQLSSKGKITLTAIPTTTTSASPFPLLGTSKAFAHSYAARTSNPRRSAFPPAFTLLSYRGSRFAADDHLHPRIHAYDTGEVG